MGSRGHINTLSEIGEKFKYDKIISNKTMEKDLKEVDRMKWQEVRELFPDQFVLVSILNYHEEGNKKIIDEVAPIRSISEQDANKEFFQVEPGSLVYHTSNQDFVIHLRRDPLIRVRRSKDEN